MSMDSTRSPEIEPPVAAQWWFRGVALTLALVASVCGLLVPGLHSVAPGWLVELGDRVASVLSFGSFGLLVYVALGGLRWLWDSPESLLKRGSMVVLATLSLLFAMPALLGPLPVVALLPMACVAMVALLVGSTALRCTGTRLLGAVALFLAIAAGARLVAWGASSFAFARASGSAFAVAEALAVAASVSEAAVALLVLAWIATRGRWLGALVGILGLGAALALIVLAAPPGGGAGTGFSLSVLRTFQSAEAGEPLSQPSLVRVTFAVSSCLALAATFSRRVAPDLVLVMVLLLLSRGRLDVPFRALSALTAAIWLLGHAARAGDYAAETQSERGT